MRRRRRGKKRRKRREAIEGRETVEEKMVCWTTSVVTSESAYWVIYRGGVLVLVGNASNVEGGDIF